MTENNMDINSELLKINEELKAEIARHNETTRLLTEKQQFLTNILTNAPIVIWCIDNEGIFTYSQFAGENALPDSERIGKSALEIYKGTEVEPFLRKVIKDEIHNGILSVHGVVYDTRVSPLFDANGNKTGYMGVSMDITNRIKAEKELEKFRLVLDQAPGAVYIMDKNWNFEYINPWFTRISGYKSEELLHKNISDTLYKGYDKVPDSRAAISQALLAGNSWQGELNTINKNGSRYWANTIAAPYKNQNGEIDGYVVIQQDITEKKKIETELAEKENLYRTLIEKSLDGVSISQDGKIILANQAFCDMFGYTTEELLAKEPSELIAESDREWVLDLHFKRMRGEVKSNSYIAGMLHKNGSEIIVDINAATVLMNGRNASFVTMRNVTEKNRMQKALKESEIKYKTLVDNSQDGILIIRNNQILFANNTICRMLKTTPEELTAMPATDIVHPDDRPKAQAMSARRQKGEIGTMLDNYRLLVITGGYIETESFSTVIDYEGLPASFITVHDITEKKRMQEELVKSEEKYRTLIEKAVDGIIITQHGKLKFVNEAFCKLIQFKEDELIDRAYLDYVAPEDHEKMISYHSRRMEGEDFQVMYRSKIYKKDGSPLEVELNARTSEYNGEPAAFIIIRDITQRVRIEQELAKSEQKYRDLTELLPQTVYELDVNGNIIYFNQTGLKQFGLDNSDIGKSSFNFIHPSQHEWMRENMKKTITEKTNSIGNKYTAVRKNGETFPAMTFASPIIFEDKVIGIRGLILDISEPEAMGKALLESEKRYRELAELLPQTVYEHDMDGKLTYLNEAGKKTFGIESLETGVSANDLVVAEDIERMLSNMQKSSFGNTTSRGNSYTAMRLNGEKFPVMIFATPMISEEKITGIRGIVIDMTEYMAMENALRESEQKYKTLVENSLEGITIIRDNRILYANDTYCKMLGYSCDELYNMPSVNTLHPDDREKALKIAERRQNLDNSTIFEDFRMLTCDGKIIECETTSTMIEYGGELASFFTSHDVTENRKMELKLRESEEKYRLLFEAESDAIFMIDADTGQILDINPAASKIYGYLRDEFLQMKNTDVSAEPDKTKEATHRLDTKVLLRYHRKKDGTIFPVELGAGFTTFKGKNIQIVTSRDITENKKMQDALSESERKFRTLIDKATDGILITQSGVFKFVNPAFCEMMQYTEKELINKPFIDVVDKKHHAEMLENHKRRMSGETFPAIYRAKLYRKDGQSIMVELNSRTTDFEGNPASFVITRDITDRLQTEEELRNAKAQLEKLNQNLEYRVKDSTLKLTEANTQLIRLQKENLQSQFEVLRQQVNPHFLFNSLNVLTSLIKLEPDLAEQFTEHLSKVYRYVLENKDNDLVNLHTELDFLDAYVFLLHIRFMDKIVVKVDIADDKKELLILPLALQLLIENAIKHNSMSKKNPLIIEITIDTKNVLNVVNNLQERESHMVSTGVGLKNIEHRYHLLEMPAPQFIKTETKFIARIPLRS